jgi:hypothetical protein
MQPQVQCFAQQKIYYCVRHVSIESACGQISNRDRYMALIFGYLVKASAPEIKCCRPRKIRLSLHLD